MRIYAPLQIAATRSVSRTPPDSPSPRHTPLAERLQLAAPRQMQLSPPPVSTRLGSGIAAKIAAINAFTQPAVRQAGDNTPGKLQRVNQVDGFATAAARPDVKKLKLEAFQHIANCLASGPPAAKPRTAAAPLQPQTPPPSPLPSTSPALTAMPSAPSVPGMVPPPPPPPPPTLLAPQAPILVVRPRATVVPASAEEIEAQRAQQTPKRNSPKTPQPLHADLLQELQKRLPPRLE